MSNLAKNYLRTRSCARPHSIGDHAEGIAIWPLFLINPPLAAIPREPVFGRKNMNLLEYIDIFVEDFLGLSQFPTYHHSHFRRTLFHSLYQIFQTKDVADPPAQK